MSNARLKTVKREPLPSAWIDRIFSKLSARFGRDFLGRWEGLDLDVVKADWAEELAGLQDRPDAIKYALENIGTKPPNVGEFKEICGRAPVAGLLALDQPRASEDVIERAIGIAREALLREKGDHLDTLRKLAASDAASGTFNGRPVTPAQRDVYRKALGKK